MMCDAPHAPDDAHDRAATPTGTAGCAGCVIFLIDESLAQQTPVAEGTKSKADCVATALNSLLKRLATEANLDVAVVGYRSNEHGRVDVAARWDGPLAGRTLLNTSRLAEGPCKVERRVRKVPDPSGVGVLREQTVEFPVWYEPTLGHAAPQTAAYEYCCRLAAAWLATPGAAPKPPLVMSFLGDLPDSEPWTASVGQMLSLGSPGGQPLVFHAHLSSSARVPPTLYPCEDAHLPPGPVSELFGSSSYLPEPMAVALRQAQITINPGARGMIYNARMADLIRFLSLIETYAAFQPVLASPPAGVQPAATDLSAAAATAPTGPPATDATSLVVLLLDRTLSDPTAEHGRRVAERLAQHTNEVLEQIAQHAEKPLEVALVTWGADKSGQGDVRIGLSGPLQRRRFVQAAELAGGALRADKVTEKVSNGIGGIVELVRSRPVFVEAAPSGPASVLPALEAVAALLADWLNDHPGSPAPLVLHLTRGRLDAADLEQAARLCHIEAAPRGILWYHWVVTESPHRSLAYPATPADIDDPALATLWELSSPLLGAQKLAAEKPAVTAGARGIVVNGKFDLLLDGLLDVMAVIGGNGEKRGHH